MTTVGVHEAKTRLSELLRAVEAGEEVVITRGGQDVARIVAVRTGPAPRDRFGMLAHQFGEVGDWDEDESDEWGDLFGVPRA